MVVLTTQKLYFFFLSFFSFGSSLTVSIVFIRTYFSPLSSVSLTLPPRLLQIRGNDLLFCSRPFVRSIIRAFLACKKYGLLCGLKDFALIDVLVSWIITTLVVILNRR